MADDIDLTDEQEEALDNAAAQVAQKWQTDGKVYGSNARLDAIADVLGGLYGEDALTHLDSEKKKLSLTPVRFALETGKVPAADVADDDAEEVLRRANGALQQLIAKATREFNTILKTSRDATELMLRTRAFVAHFQPILAKTIKDTEIASRMAGAYRVAQDAGKILHRILHSAEPGTVPVSVPPATLPPGTLPVPSSSQPPPVPPIPLTTPQPGEPEPLVEFPIIDKAVADLYDRKLMTRDDFDLLDQESKRNAFTITGVQTEALLDKVRDALAEQVEEGADFKSFKKRIADTVGEGTFLSPGHMETVFRNNVQQSYANAQDEIMDKPVMRHLFPFVRYVAVHDDRARPHHRELEKLGIDGTAIYHADDPVWDKFRPPWEPNCRCALIYLTIDQAADHGIEEAVRWRDSGVAPMVPFRAKIPFEPTQW